MQVMYYQTKNFIRHEGNVIDLVQYRQKLAAVSGEHFSPAVDVEEETAPVLELLPQTYGGKKSQRRDLAERLDLCATLGVITMTLVAVVQFAIF